MKVRQGFVSNSSSTSYVIALTRDFIPSDKSLSKFIDDAEDYHTNKKMSVEEAKEYITEWDKKGMVHMVMSEGQGFIGGICNCDYPDCLQIRHRLDYGLNYTLTKAHYVAKVNYETCNGCGVCVQRCQFGALKLEVTTQKASIDQFRCFGCGVCQTGCPRGSIELLERMSLPALREVW